MRRLRTYTIGLTFLTTAGLVACGGEPSAATAPDLDEDGVPDDIDRCLFTEPGVAVDDGGCADVAQAGEQLVPDGAPEEDLDGDGEVRPSERVLSARPATGDVHAGFYPIVLGADGDNPHIFHAHEANVEETETAIVVDGDLTLATPGGFIVLEDGQLTFPKQGSDVVSVEGVVRLPMPGFGMLEGVEARVGAAAAIGYRPGRELDVDLPLVDDRPYLHFVVESGAVFGAGDLLIETDGPGAVVIVDPHDPAVLLRGDLIGLGAIGPVEDVAIGLSFQGLIPFEPLVEPDRFDAFSGHVFLAGVVPVPGVPLTLLGDTVVRVPTPLPEAAPVVDVGANGQLDATVDVLGFTVYEMTIADGTAIVSADERGVYAEWAGRPSVLEFTDALPLSGEASWTTGSALAGEPTESVTDASVEIDGAWLSQKLFLPIPSIPLGEGPLVTGADGVQIAAPLGGQLSLAGVTFGAGVDVAASFAPDGSDFEIVLDGYATTGFGDPVLTTVTLSPSGVDVSM